MRWASWVRLPLLSCRASAMQVFSIVRWRSTFFIFECERFTFSLFRFGRFHKMVDAAAATTVLQNFATVSNWVLSNCKQVLRRLPCRLRHARCSMWYIAQACSVTGLVNFLLPSGLIMLQDFWRPMFGIISRSTTNSHFLIADSLWSVWEMFYVS